MLLIGIGLTIPPIAKLLSGSEGYFFRGVFLPAWTNWSLLLGGLFICIASIYRVLRNLNERALQKNADTDSITSEDKANVVATKQADADPPQAGLEHTPLAGQTSSPRGEDKENPANKEETCMTENNKETENKKDT